MGKKLDEAKTRAAYTATALSRAKILEGQVYEELQRALTKHGPMNSAHEGYSVILEELDELWDEVKKKTSARSRENMRTEAIQVAAMAMRFVLDVTDKKE